MTAPVDERAVDAARTYDRWFDREWGRYSSRVETRRDGRWGFYSLVDEHVRVLLQATLNHLERAHG